jgi:hypothetical protein
LFTFRQVTTELFSTPYWKVLCFGVACI